MIAPALSPENISRLEKLVEECDIFPFLSEEWRSNFSVAKAAVNRNGYDLKYASPDLQDDYEIVYTAMIANRNGVNYASPRIKEAIKLNSGVDELDILIALIRDYQQIERERKLLEAGLEPKKPVSTRALKV